ncbi:MAG TPA: squalene/phytoene synthase family protein, partial [Halanaerobiales bacterium]|nr:squalene/phytoene synthase family protein [Halanaerobiales bacterium]
MSEEAWEFCRSILPGVSRSFALTIPVLDGELYRPVLINYLIDRLLDNFEDELDRDNFSLDERKMMMDKVVKLFNPASKDYFAEVNEIKEYGK